VLGGTKYFIEEEQEQEQEEVYFEEWNAVK
jgi:hypothetical protein